MTPLILASSSVARAKLLRAAGLEVDVEPAGIDEARARAAHKSATSAQLAAFLAEQKALSVAAKHPGRVVLGADQILEFQGEAIGKCATVAGAAALLRRLRGQSHALVTAAALARRGEILWRCVDRSGLVMRAFSDGFLEAYLARAGETVLSAVGCYEAERLGAQLFETIDGDLFSIMGLPLVPVLGALREHGVIAR